MYDKQFRFQNHKGLNLISIGLSEIGNYFSYKQPLIPQGTWQMWYNPSTCKTPRYITPMADCMPLTSGTMKMAEKDGRTILTMAGMPMVLQQPGMRMEQLNLK